MHLRRTATSACCWTRCWATQTLFAHRDGVETTWALFTPVIEAWAKKYPQTFPNYAAGTWGPECGDELIGRDGHTWHTIPLPSKDGEGKAVSA